VPALANRHQAPAGRHRHKVTAGPVHPAEAHSAGAEAAAHQHGRQVRVGPRVAEAAGAEAVVVVVEL
jgi:hypothetical protein